MEAVKSCRAFEDKRFNYYELTQDLGGLVPKGAIFVHDTDDKEYGSYAEGCLKLCWTKDGNCYKGRDGMICGGTVIFHASFRNTYMFKLVMENKVSKLENLIYKLESQLESAKEELKKITK